METIPTIYEARIGFRLDRSDNKKRESQKASYNSCDVCDWVRETIDKIIESHEPIYIHDPNKSIKEWHPVKYITFSWITDRRTSITVTNIGWNGTACFDYSVHIGPVFKDRPVKETMF